ncbi:MAG: hemolysin family protein [Candidatus Aminicenantales bacterium]
MLIPSIILFFLFLGLSAFFSSSETAFIASNPYKLDHQEKQGSGRARLAKKLLSRVDNLLATILVGNTLVNTAAASIATFIFVSFIPDKNEAVLLATLTTTLLILIFAEITPKTYAAHNSLKVSLLFSHPIRMFIVLFYPFVRAFTFLSRLIFPSPAEDTGIQPKTLSEEELRLLLTKGMLRERMSSFRRRMISGVLDIASRPIREIMVPRPQIKAIDINASLQEIQEVLRSTGFSRIPVYSGRLDNIEGTIHSKDIIPYLFEKKEVKLPEIIRKPFFIPESAPVEKALRQMQQSAVHLAFVVDEFGNMEGIVTLEDIIEEIVGEIQDEYDVEVEDWIKEVSKDVYLIKGNTPIKEINQRLSMGIPERVEYTTLAGFFLYKYGKIPQEKDELIWQGRRFIVERMGRRKINLIRLIQEGGRTEYERRE